MKSACSAQFLDQPRDVHLTQVTLVIVAVFIVCHSVRWIPNMWEMKQAGTDAVRVIFFILHFLVQYFPTLILPIEDKNYNLKS